MEAKMAYMTDEEADALDEGTARILNAKALATHRTPAELVAEMVREQLAVP
jgi:hypothetical protein